MRQTSVPSAGFEPAIPPTKRSKTYALDLAAAGIGKPWQLIRRNCSDLRFTTWVIQCFNNTSHARSLQKPEVIKILPGKCHYKCKINTSFLFKNSTKLSLHIHYHWSRKGKMNTQRRSQISIESQPQILRQVCCTKLQLYCTSCFGQNIQC
jgi:hypothetical protein